MSIADYETIVHTTLQTSGMRTMFEPTRCKKCRDLYVDHEDSDEYDTGLCYECFEGELEKHEERRRERIARANEY